jgi:hypothetical protein
MFLLLMSPQLIAANITLPMIVVASRPEAMVLDTQMNGLSVAFEIAGASE